MNQRNNNICHKLGGPLIEISKNLSISAINKLIKKIKKRVLKRTLFSRQTNNISMSKTRRLEYSKDQFCFQAEGLCNA